MSISYNAIVGNKQKVSFPSVDEWYLNSNILKDPPKSIMTRRIDKVNEDGSLNEMLYDSGDRFAENLNVYARGVNPMVSVQYSNANGAPVKQPYRILNEGAFRPPQLRQEQLLPLSRLPRNTTQAITNKEFKNYSSKVTCSDTNKYFRQNVLRGIIAPTKYVKIAMPVKEHFEVSHVIQNPTIATATTNPSSLENIQIQPSIPVRQKDTLHSAHITNQSGQNGHTYMHDDIQLSRNLPATSTSASKSALSNATVDPDNELQLQRNLPIYNVGATKRSNVTYLADDHNTSYELKSKLKAHSVIGNKTDTDHSQQPNRVIRLKDKVQPGELNGITAIPQAERTMTYNSDYTTAKTRLASNVRQVSRK